MKYDGLLKKRGVASETRLKMLLNIQSVPIPVVRGALYARGLKAKTEKNFDAPSQATQAEVAARATKARIAPINAEYLIC